MASPIWFVNFLKFIFPTRKPVARLSRIPPVGFLMDKTIFNGDEMVYLPKDCVAVGEAVNPAGSTVLPSAVVDHFIEKASYHFIMNFCICRDGDDCQDYPHDLGCIFLGEAVMRINPKMGRRVTRDEALAHARRARELGLVHLIGRDRVDSIWLGTGPVSRLMTICNCCPCCCLYRILPDLHPQISQRIQRMPGVRVAVDAAACKGCNKCVRNGCFVDALRLVDGVAQISEDCRGCGRCVEICPQRAIHLTIQDGGYIQKTIQRISTLVDVNGHKG